MSILGWLLLLLIPVILIFFLRSGSPRRLAVRYVVSIFRKRNAIDAEHALTDAELGLKPVHRNENQFITALVVGWGLKEEEARYDALKSMIKDGIVKTTSDGRMYLSESRLASLGLFKS